MEITSPPWAAWIASPQGAKDLYETTNFGLVHGNNLSPNGRKMRAAGAHEEAIRSFEDAYTRLRSGGESLLATADLEPVGDVPAFEDLPDTDAAQALAQTALIKLNGGLATSMGLQEPKSLIEVHGGHTFLDVIVGQAQALRARYGVQLPLILMRLKKA